MLVNAPLSVQLRIGDACHSKGIYFLSTESRGAFTTAFVDLGNAFEVLDGNGEEPLSGAVADLSVDGIVTMLPKIRHGLETGNAVKLMQVEGLQGVSAEAYKVKVLNPNTFALQIESSKGSGSFSSPSFTGKFVPGTATWQEVKVPFIVRHKSLRESIEREGGPEFAMTDFVKLDTNQIYVAIRAVHRFAEECAEHAKALEGATTFANFLPRPWNSQDVGHVLQLAREIASKSHAVSSEESSSPQFEKLVRQVTFTFQGGLVGLTAFMGGMLGQEVLKSLSGKFTPMSQWICVDTREVIPDVDVFSDSNFLQVGDRVDGQALVIGRDVCAALGKQRVFMIGSGAIGCEMLKNLAMMGVGVTSSSFSPPSPSDGTSSSPVESSSGVVIVTDNDLIENSNLNRQFLFRKHNIGEPKSSAAAKAIVAMNPHILVESHQHKVGADTEHVYTNAFWRSLDLVVNALDNIPARLYVDSKCVENQRPLVESGTMGTKGHVQVIVPHLTANYGSTRDPPEAGIPLCTLKSFPSQIEHTIQWARDKWTTLFHFKPEEAKAILADLAASDMDALAHKIELKRPGKKDFQHVYQLFAGMPRTFQQCIYQARRKFETYYVNSITQLLHAFPIDHKNDDGTLFWALPRRPPKRITFDAREQDHLDFIINSALLYAKAYGIKQTHDPSDRAYYAQVASGIALPPYVIKTDHHIETNEAVTKETAAAASKRVEASSSSSASDSSFAETPKKREEWAPGEFEERLKAFREVLTAKKGVVPFSDEFEKDDDRNHHIDFITAASNLRAQQYGIQPVDRMKTKFVAGKIIPAMATSTAAITGLASVELIKLVKSEKSIESFKNSWMNLALPSLLLSEPQAVERSKISDHLSISIWDRWVVNEGDLVLGQFINHFKREYKLIATAIIQNTSLIYAALLGGKKALPQRMSTLLSRPEGAQFVDLTVQFESLDGKEVRGPPVRFFFEQQQDDDDDSDSDSDSDDAGSSDGASSS